MAASATPGERYAELALTLPELEHAPVAGFVRPPFRASSARKEASLRKTPADVICVARCFANKWKREFKVDQFLV